MSTSKTRLSRDNWVLGAVELMAKDGVERVRVEVLAKHLGVTKGSFYWHFKNRAALLEAVVQLWESNGTQRLIDAVEASAAEPRAKIRTLWQMATADDLGAELALREWARKNPDLAERVQKVDRVRLDYLRGLFEAMGHDTDEANRRSMQVYSLLIGAYFIQVVDAALVEGCIASLLA